MENVLKRLTGHVENVPPRFLALAASERLHKPAPGKWSKQEILGHLADSALNNLKRFTEAQFLPQPYTVIRYQQDDLVAVNNYQQLNAESLCALWQSLNLQIIHVVAHIPAEKWHAEVIIPTGEQKTLHWLITDYADHMEHHLRQIFGTWP